MPRKTIGLFLQPVEFVSSMVIHGHKASSSPGSLRLTEHHVRERAGSKRGGGGGSSRTTSRNRDVKRWRIGKKEKEKLNGPVDRGRMER